LKIDSQKIENRIPFSVNSLLSRIVLVPKKTLDQGLKFLESETKHSNSESEMM
jgi:hypothetical protein